MICTYVLKSYFSYFFSEKWQLSPVFEGKTASTTCKTIPEPAKHIQALNRTIESVFLFTLNKNSIIEDSSVPQLVYLSGLAEVIGISTVYLFYLLPRLSKK